MSNENVCTLPDGNYKGLWSGYVVTVMHNGEVHKFKTKLGVRGFNIPRIVEVKDGIPTISAPK